MFDTSIYRQGQSLESGLRAGSMMGSAVRGAMDMSAVKQAAARIQAGEDQQAVIAELMAQSPQAAQQLMNLLGGQTNLDAATQEVISLKQKVGDQTMQRAAIPIFGAFATNSDEQRKKLLDESATYFDEQSPEVANTIRQIGTLQGRQQFDAVGSLVKSLRQAGVFPDDPSQLIGGQSADIAKFEYWKQMNPNATEKEAREVYNKIIDPFYRAQASASGAAGVKLETEQALNKTLADRAAATATAVEGTAGGKAELAAQQAAAEKAQNELKEEEIRKAKQIDLSKQAMTLAREVANDPMLGAVTGIAAKVPTINPASESLIIKAQQLVAMLTSENMKLMSGVLTQADMELLQTLSTGLRVDEKGIKGSHQAVAKQLNMIADKIERTLMEKGALEKKPVQQGGQPRNYENEYMGRN